MEAISQWRRYGLTAWFDNSHVYDNERELQEGETFNLVPLEILEVNVENLKIDSAKTKEKIQFLTGIRFLNIENEVEGLKQTICDIREDNFQRAEKEAEFRERISGLESLISAHNMKYEKEVSNLKIAYDTQKHENDQLRTQIATINTRCNQLEESLLRSPTEIPSARRSIGENDQSTSLIMRNGDNSNLESQLEQIAEDVRRIKHQCEVLEGIVRTNYENVHHNKCEICRLRNEHEVIEQNLKDQQCTVVSNRQNIVDVKDKVNVLGQDVMVLQRTVHLRYEDIANPTRCGFDYSGTTIPKSVSRYEMRTNICAHPSDQLCVSQSNGFMLHNASESEKRDILCLSHFESIPRDIPTVVEDYRVDSEERRPIQIQDVVDVTCHQANTSRDQTYELMEACFREGNIVRRNVPRIRVYCRCNISSEASSEYFNSGNE